MTTKGKTFLALLFITVTLWSVIFYAIYNHFFNV